jgi:hypothetical protein
LRQPRFEAGLCLGDQEVVERHAGRRRELRQVSSCPASASAAAARDLDGVFERFGQVGEQLGHLGLRS